MAVKLLGLLDIFAAVIIVLFHFKIIHNPLVLSMAFYLIFKAMIFFGDAFSIVDGIVGLYMLFMIIHSVELLSFVFAIYLILKGITSIM
jgi:hypothetical protein